MTGTNNIETLIPRLDENISIQNFNNDEYLIIQEKLDFRLKVNENTYRLVSLIDGVRDIPDITFEFNSKFNQHITESIVKKTLYENLGQYGILNNNTLYPKDLL